MFECSKHQKGEYFFVTDQNKNAGTSSNDNSSDILIGLSVTFAILGVIGGFGGIFIYIKKKRNAI
jgi:hypothetical protein